MHLVIIIILCLCCCSSGPAASTEAVGAALENEVKEKSTKISLSGLSGAEVRR